MISLAHSETKLISCQATYFPIIPYKVFKSVLIFALFFESKMGNSVGSCSMLKEIMLSSFLPDHEMSWWHCTFLQIKACHCSLLRTLLPVFAVELAWCTPPPPCFKGILDKRASDNPSSLSSVFPWFVWLDRAPGVKLWWQGSLSMVLTDHQNNPAELRATLMSSVPWPNSVTALCQSQANFRTLGTTYFLPCRTSSLLGS